MAPRTARLRDRALSTDPGGREVVPVGDRGGRGDVPAGAHAHPDPMGHRRTEEHAEAAVHWSRSGLHRPVRGGLLVDRQLRTARETEVERLTFLPGTPVGSTQEDAVLA